MNAVVGYGPQEEQMCKNYDAYMLAKAKGLTGHPKCNRKS